MSKERFNRRIVDAIATSRHRLNHLQSFDLLDIERVGVVETLVGMNQYVLKHDWSENRVILHSLHGIEHQAHFQMHRQVPGHDFAACDILHDGQVGKTVIERDIGDVGGKYLERSKDVKGTIQYVFIRTMFQRFLHNHLVRVVPSDLGDEMILILNANDLFVIHDDLFFQKFHLNRPPTIFGLPSKKYFVVLPDGKQFKFLGVRYRFLATSPHVHVL